MHLLELGFALSEIYTFLDPASQHELRSTTLEAAVRFDTAAGTAALTFYTHSHSHSNLEEEYSRGKHTPLRWQTCPLHPNSGKSPQSVVVNVRNYYFSTLNTRCQTNDSVAAPELTDYDEYSSANVHVHSFVLMGFDCRKMHVTGLDGIKFIDIRFCERLEATELTFDGANQLESIGHHFLLRCPKLKKVSFNGSMPKLAVIGNCFMSECPELEEVDFSGLTALQRIGSRFLFNSPQLRRVNFTPFSRTLAFIGNSFLGYASRVEDLEAQLRVLKSVQEIDNVGRFSPYALRVFAAEKTMRCA